MVNDGNSNKWWVRLCYGNWNLLEGIVGYGCALGLLYRLTQITLIILLIHA